MNFRRLNRAFLSLTLALAVLTAPAVGHAAAVTVFAAASTDASSPISFNASFCCSADMNIFDVINGMTFP